MRAGCDPEFIRNTSGRIFAINLGADFVSEHEWGISGLRNALGIKFNAGFIGCCMSEKFDKKCWQWFNSPEQMIFGFWNPYQANYVVGPENMPRDLNDYNPINTAWDENSFGIMLRKPTVEIREFICELYKAAQDKGIAIMFGGTGSPFGNAGLVIAISCLVPQEVMNRVDEKSAEKNKLTNAMAATGIENTLRYFGKHYFALSPKFKKDGTLVFWLNPMEQHLYNYGWFTLADLKLWAQNQGPIMQEKKMRR